MFTAHQTAGLSRTERIEPLKYYLDKLKPREVRKQTPAEMIATLRAIKASVAH